MLIDGSLHFHAYGKWVNFVVFFKVVLKMLSISEIDLLELSRTVLDHDKVYFCDKQAMAINKIIVGTLVSLSRQPECP